jgi:succinate dehydrogenase / fumarate reductase flavoprotein subunit
MWDHVGMSRTRDGLERAVRSIRTLRNDYWRDVNVPGRKDTLNKHLEFAGRVADYMELAELMALDALHREESSGGHFREEHQTADGEALRNDDDYAYVAAWEFTGEVERPKLHKEQLEFEYVQPTTRSYK